jgi:hypothetical protein
MPASISASLRGENEVEETANILMKFKDFDVTINSSCITNYFKPDKIEIIGSDSSLTILDNRILIKKDVDDLSKRNLILKRILGAFGFSVRKVKYCKPLRFQDVYVDFIRAIKEDTVPAVAIENVKDSLEILFKIKKSGK